MINENLDEKRTEGRLLTRLHSRLKLAVDTPNEGAENLVDCITRDISFAGICLLIEIDLPVGSRCMLKIEDRHTEVEYDHMCEVTWCREKDGEYLLGLHINEHLCDVAKWKNMVIGLLAG